MRDAVKHYVFARRYSFGVRMADNSDEGDDAGNSNSNRGGGLGRSRHLATQYPVTFTGARSIIAIRVGFVDATTGANVLPTYCDQTCVYVRELACARATGMGCLLFE